LGKKSTEKKFALFLEGNSVDNRFLFPIIGKGGIYLVKSIQFYFPYFTIFSVIVVDIIIFYALMDVLNVFEKEIIVAIIGFIGSILGGLLTLIGVKWTLNSQARKENILRYERANYVFTELLPDLIAVYNSIKSLNPKNWNETIDIVDENAKKLEEKASQLASEARHINMDFYRGIKTVEYYGGVIYNYIENYSGKKTDQEMLKSLHLYYQGLAKTDNNLMKMVNDIK
jgi:hypothetical protein